MCAFRVLTEDGVALDPRLEGTDVLWRYLDLPRFLDLLQRRRLFLARGDTFLDRFEGQFTASIKRAIERAYDEHPEWNFTYEAFRRKLRERVFVSCWHRSAHESVAMWSTYGPGVAVAVTTTVARLREAAVEANLRGVKSIELVDYIDYSGDPELDISPYSRVFAYKDRAYSHESEVRLISDRSVNEFDHDVIEPGMYMGVDPAELLSSVVVSPAVAPWQQELLHGVVEAYGYRITVHESDLLRDPL